MDNSSEIKRILKKIKTIAVVGLSRDPSKDSFIVAKYLKEHSYRIIPINPYADEVLNENVIKVCLICQKN
jgi:predicted CoA-binding protein